MNVAQIKSNETVFNQTKTKTLDQVSVFSIIETLLQSRNQKDTVMSGTRDTHTFD